MSTNSIGHNGVLRFQASPLIQAGRYLGLSTVMTKDFKQLDYAILVGEWGQFAVVEKDKKVFDIEVSDWTDILTIERHNSDTINYCLNGKVFKTPYQVFFERTGIDARQLGVVPSLCLLLRGYASLSFEIRSSSVTITPL
jgi:hypothetical protein